MALRARVRIKRGAFSGKVFVAGFHGVGYVGYLAVRHLARALRGRLVGYVVSPYMPQYASMSSHGIVSPYELYDVGPAVVFLPNVPLSRGDLTRVPYALAGASIRGGARMAVLVGGLDNRFRRGEPNYRYAATRAFMDAYSGALKGGKPLEEGLYMVGPLAAMMTYYSAYEFPAVAILPYADASGADPLAAKEAVDLVARILGVEVDTSELLRLAEEKAKLERELEEVRKRAERGEETPTFYV